MQQIYPVKTLPVQEADKQQIRGAWGGGLFVTDMKHSSLSEMQNTASPYKKLGNELNGSIQKYSSQNIRRLQT